MPEINLHPHQLDALEELHNGCVCTGGVGTGKTITSIAYYYIKVCEGGIRHNGRGSTTPMRKPRDLVVITTARKRDDRDWEKEAALFGISTDREISFSGVKIHVDSWNNIGRYSEVKDAFFIFDEQRLVGSGSWTKAFIKIARQNQWIMLSATPGDTWLDYCPLFIANGFFKNRTEFIRNHVVYNNFSKFPKIDRYVETGILLKMRKAILVDMPYERKTKRLVKNALVGFDQELFDKVYKERWHIYEDRPIRDVGELFRVMRKLVNSDHTRIMQVKHLWEKHPRLIVFYNFDYELMALREMAEELHAPYAEWNGHRHQEVPEDAAWFYFVQYTAGAEAWNCITTDAMVFFSLNYSYKVNQQAFGRIDRLNTPFTDLYYYILRSNSVIDNAITKSLATKKNFNEKDFVRASRSA